jgi:hypothetical protein
MQSQASRRSARPWFHNFVVPVLGTMMIVCICTLSFLPNAGATQKTAIASGNWTNTSTWNGGLIPIQGDSVTIGIGFSVTIDANTASLGQLLLKGGTLNGGKDTLFILGSFTGSGTFNPDSGAVYFNSPSIQHIAIGTIPVYYDLILSTQHDSVASRVLDQSCTVLRNFTCDFRQSPTSHITGLGSLTVGGSFTYLGDSTSEWFGKILLNDQRGDTSVYLRVAPPNGPSFGKPFRFPHIIIQKPDTTFFVRFGFPDSNNFIVPATDSLIGDSVYMTLAGFAPDTTISLQGGTLDAGAGIFSVLGGERDAAHGPFVHLAQGTRFRMRRVIPRTQLPSFDSTTLPYIACDSGSSFEYYNYGVTDASLIINNLVHRAYANLIVSCSTVVGLKFNPVIVEGDLHIQLGGMIDAGITRGPLKQEEITIRGDVYNDNTGESHSVGTGKDGDGMNLDNDHWTFDKPNGISHWYGPSEINALTVDSTTTLSIRFLSDTACDSLYYEGSIEEKGDPCGGRILGRLFTIPARFDSNTTSSTFGNIGLDITTGTLPALGFTYVVRTSGYDPPGVFLGTSKAHTVKRYFRITNEASPQHGNKNSMTFHYDCSEVVSAARSGLKFWRSTDNGSSWALSGANSYDLNTGIVTWDTLAIGYPNKQNSYLWTLSDQTVDIPLSVGLLSFTSKHEVNQVQLDWQTASEINSLGFELEKTMHDTTSLVGSWDSNPLYRSRSGFGAKYQVYDTTPIEDSTTYRLFERSTDGERVLLATSTLAPDIRKIPTLTSQLRLLIYPAYGGTEAVVWSNTAQPVTLTLFDMLGRRLLTKSVNSRENENVESLLKTSNLPSGIYILRAESVDGRISRRFVLGFK